MGMVRIENNQAPMNTYVEQAIDERIVIVAPTGRDAALARLVLQRAAMDTVVAHQQDDLSFHLSEGAGALLIADEAFSREAIRAVAAFLEDQPPWSDLPIIVLTSGEDGRESSVAHQLGDQAAGASVARRYADQRRQFGIARAAPAI
jgi:hypothetical protein